MVKLAYYTVQDQPWEGHDYKKKYYRVAFPVEATQQFIGKNLSRYIVGSPAKMVIITVSGCLPKCPDCGVVIEGVRR